MDNLKSCPFCGGEAAIQTSTSDLVPKCATETCYCKTCHARTLPFEDIKHDGTFIDKAIEAWNRRVDNGT